MYCRGVGERGGGRKGRKREVNSQMRKSNLNIHEEGFLIRGNGRLQEVFFLPASLVLEDTWKHHVCKKLGLFIKLIRSLYDGIFLCHNTSKLKPTLSYNLFPSAGFVIKSRSLVATKHVCLSLSALSQDCYLFAVISDDRGRTCCRGIVYCFDGSDRSTLP